MSYTRRTCPTPGTAKRTEKPVSVLEQELSTDFVHSEADRIELAKFVKLVVSNPDLRAVFASDPSAAIAKSGVTLSPFASMALAENASCAIALTDDMDSVITSFFFFALA